MRRPLADTVCRLRLTSSHRLPILGGRFMRWLRLYAAEVDAKHVGQFRRVQNPTSVWQFLNRCPALPCASDQFFGVDLPVCAGNFSDTNRDSVQTGSHRLAVFLEFFNQRRRSALDGVAGDMCIQHEPRHSGSCDCGGEPLRLSRKSSGTSTCIAKNDDQLGLTGEISNPSPCLQIRTSFTCIAYVRDVEIHSLGSSLYRYITRFRCSNSYNSIH